MSTEQDYWQPKSPEGLSLLSDSELAAIARALLGTLADAQIAPLLARREHSCVLQSPADVFAFLSPEMSHLAQEQLRLLTLTTRHGLLGNHLIYQGTVSSCHVRLAEMLRPAVVLQAPSVILVHNHPSGETSLSPDDLQLTRRLIEAGTLLDIEVVDHVVIAGESYKSCRESGLMPFASPPSRRLSDLTRGVYGGDRVVGCAM